MCRTFVNEIEADRLPLSIVLQTNDITGGRESRDTSVDIATRYRLDGPGIESRWGGARFSAPDQTGPGAHPAFYTMGTGSFLGVKRPGRGVDHPPPSCTEVKERVQLYIYSLSGPSWPVLRWPLPYLYVQDIHEYNRSRRTSCTNSASHQWLSFFSFRL
jgi:hypothetical protein